MSNIITYITGFDYLFTDDFSRKEYLNLCRLISNHLNQLYNLSGKKKIKIVPDTLVSGMKFTGKGYGSDSINDSLDNNVLPGKSFRHTEITSDETFTWPWNTNNLSIDTSYIDSSGILFSKGTSGSSVLESADGIPFWTMKELMIFKESFESFGIEVRNTPNIIS